MCGMRCPKRLNQMSSGATWSGTLPGMGYELVEGVPHGFEAGTPDTEGTSAWERLSTSLEGGGIDVGLEHSLPQGQELADLSEPSGGSESTWDVPAAESASRRSCSTGSQQTRWPRSFRVGSTS